MRNESRWMCGVDLASLGREVGATRSRTVRMAIRAAFALVAMTGTGSALAQGGICLSNCGDGGGQPLEPISISAFVGVWDPCGGGWCNNGGGNDDPPDEGGAMVVPETATVKAEKSSRVATTHITLVP